ncbi:MAG: ribulose-phosphate 3-epimerase [Bacteroidota bacterium]|nr:ribulose-phosphate 3-epimerase [Bacteroidota bacterium]MDP4229432.1 ribulose-phosphate 3-epimerase [Bacteroidota bacterium]MDP4235932.1 ribulose-phosphate 3-epimerase [Bacteroidota bacterium]
MQKRNPVIIAPSLLSANFARLEEDVRMLEKAGADWLHIDVMDGHFVPNITIGPLVVAALRKITKLPLDCHLMITEPDRYIPDFVKAGANIITVHVEACPHLHRTVQHIKSLGVKAGVTLNPATPVSSVKEILPDADMILLMSVNPGFGGQEFIPSLYRRAATISQWIHSQGLNCLIEADGGIKLDNIADVYASGVDAIVSGSGIFSASDPGSMIASMRKACSNVDTVSV